MEVVPGQKKVLVLGAGYVAGPAVEYLSRDSNIQVTVGRYLSYKV
jgi:alpha-aminoadipic semialdehyde synthase